LKYDTNSTKAIQGVLNMHFFLQSLLVVIFQFSIFTSVTLGAEVSLSGAASLKEAVNEISATYSKTVPGVKITKNYSGSGVLAKQIENGAPADIFISANTEWMDYLNKKGLVDAASISIFAYNTLVFAGKDGSNVTDMNGLQKLNKIAIGSPKSVPAGEYAMTAFQKAGIEKQLQKKLVMARDVRESLMYAERGEVAGAFVYKTDALQARQAKILFTVPQNLYPRVSYPAALTAKGAKNADAKAFYKFLSSKEAKNVLAKYGFETR
jgi:molybdate transport system substrate-binding protein